MRAVAGLILFLLTCLPAAAQGTLPFGLHGFHWIMSMADARAAFAGQASEEKRPPAAPMNGPQMSMLSMGPYAWKNCSFDVGFTFGNGRLQGVRQLNYFDLTLDAPATSNSFK